MFARQRGPGSGAQGPRGGKPASSGGRGDWRAIPRRKACRVVRRSGYKLPFLVGCIESQTQCATHETPEQEAARGARSSRGGERACVPSRGGVHFGYFDVRIVRNSGYQLSFRQIVSNPKRHTQAAPEEGTASCARSAGGGERAGGPRARRRTRAGNFFFFMTLEPRVE